MQQLSRFNILQNSYLKCPIRITYRVTNECNQFCRHCWPDAGISKYKELSTSQALEVIDRIIDLGALMLVINGGEPMLRDDIFEILEYASKKNLWVQITSSGYGITEEACELFKKIHIHRVVISLEGHNKEKHSAIRPREDSFDLAINALEMLKKYEIPTGISTTISTINYNDIENMAELIKAYDVKFWDLTPLMDLGRGKDLINMKLHKEQMFKLFSNINNCKTKYNEIEIQLHDPLYSRFIGEKYGIDIFTTCQAGRSELCVFPDGTVSPCRYLYNLGFGNILEDDIINLWNDSPILKKMRTVSLNDTCIHCKDYKDCLGGCRARVINSNLPLEAPDPECFYL